MLLVTIASGVIAWRIALNIWSAASAQSLCSHVQSVFICRALGSNYQRRSPRSSLGRSGFALGGCHETSDICGSARRNCCRCCLRNIFSRTYCAASGGGYVTITGQLFKRITTIIITTLIIGIIIIIIIGTGIIITGATGNSGGEGLDERANCSDSLARPSLIFCPVRHVTRFKDVGGLGARSYWYRFSDK